MSGHSRWLVAALVAIVVLCLDQATKLAVSGSLLLGERREVLGFVALERTENTGIAFGLASGAPMLLVACGALVVAALLGWFASRIEWPLGPVGLGLVVGGALGNLVDRITRGGVIDFVDLGPWPTFNLADVSITVGVALLVLGALRQDGHART